MHPKFQVSRDSRALYITVVAKDRLPVFNTNAVKLVTYRAIDEARKSGGFLLFAYVIKPDHLHLLTDSRGVALRQRTHGSAGDRLSEGTQLPEFTCEVAT